MIRTMWDNILKMFGKKSTTNDAEQERNERYVYNYEDDKDINFAAIFANKLAKYTMYDANIDIKADNKRAELLDDSLKRLVRKLKKIIARELGTGGVVIVPYVTNNKLYYNVIAQNRLIINKKIGDDIVDCTILAEHIVRNQKNYYRWADYTLENGNMYIRYRATMESTPIDMSTIEEWSNIQDVAITNVNKNLFAFIKSPIDNRKENDDYGVPITYGCEKQIKRVLDTLEQIDREYKLKEVFIGADATMFKGEGALPKNGLYKRINGGEDNFWEIFDPAFRDTPLFNKLMQECALLEKQIGTSRGILTDPLSTYQNTQESKRGTFDTFSMVDDIRSSLEDGISDFLYACDVLANYFNLTPQGDYKTSIDWSYALLEDDNEKFNQISRAVSMGIMKKAELRQFMKPNETIDEAQAIIDEIKAETPTTKDLLGE